MKLLLKYYLELKKRNARQKIHSSGNRNITEKKFKMKTRLFINYLKYYNIYHIGIFYVTVITINMCIGMVSNTAECEPPELKPYVGDPHFVPDDTIKRDGLLQGVYASGYIEKPPVNYVKPMVDATHYPVTPTPSWSIEYKMKLLGKYIMSWFSPESWYQWYQQDVIETQQADQLRKEIETQQTDQLRKETEAQQADQLGKETEAHNLTVELTNYTTNLIDGLEKLDNLSLSNTIPSKEIKEKLNALLPPIDINTDNYSDMKLKTVGKYDGILEGINEYGVERKILLIKYLVVQHNLNAFIFSALRDNKTVNEEQMENVYMFLLDKYTQTYGF